MPDRIIRVLNGGRLIAHGVEVVGRTVYVDMNGAERLDFQIDWDVWLGARTISSVANETDGPTVASQVAGDIVTLTISGNNGEIEHKITTSDGKVKAILIIVSGSGAVEPPTEPTGTAPVWDEAFEITVTAGEVASFDLRDAITDPDSDYLGVNIIAQGSGGVFALTVNGAGVAVGTGTFTTGDDFDDLAPGELETVTPTITLYDAAGHVSAVKSVTVIVTGADLPETEPPVITPVLISVLAGESVAFDLETYTVDPEDDLVGFTLVQQPAKGSIMLTANGSGIYTGPGSFFTGDDFSGLSSGATEDVTFSAFATDAAGNFSEEALFTIRVTGATPVQRAPVIANYAGSLNRNATLSITLPTPSDADGDAGANGGSLVTGPVKGILTSAATVTGWSYDPDGEYDDLYTGNSATETFTYKWTDIAGNVSNIATATLTINGVGSPAAEPDYPYMAFLPAAEMPSMMAFMALPAAAANVATITSVGSGLWSAASTWTPARVPIAGDNVKIVYGHTVTYDEAKASTVAGNKAYNFIEVHGKLVMSPLKSTRLRCDTLWGAYASELEIRVSLPFDAEISILSNGAINVTTDPHKFGRGVAWHGIVDILGVAVDAVACNSTYPVAGATTLTLASTPTNWKVGDTIVIPGTDLVKRAPPVAFQDEVRTITNIAGNVITWSGGLMYAHNGINRFLGEVTPVKDYGDGTGNGGEAPKLMIMNMGANIRFVSEGADLIDVQRRPHMMVMMQEDGANVSIQNCAFIDFGRTNKRVQAFTIGQAGTVTTSTNLKGRYPLHLHWCAFRPDTWRTHANPSTVRGVKIYRSPGWGITQHRGAANTSYCQTFDMFGHLVWETGDEVSATVDNNVQVLCRARRSSGSGTTGNVIITKSSVFVDNHDNFASGSGIGSESRAINLTNNYIYSSEGDAIVFLHRGKYATNTVAAGIHEINSLNMEDPDAHAFQTRIDIDFPRIRGFKHVQVFGANGSGLHVIKSGPSMEHDLRTFMDDFIALNCNVGATMQYTGHYSFRRFLILGPNSYTGSEGFHMALSALDMVADRFHIGGYPIGIVQEHEISGSGGTRPQPNAGAFQQVFQSCKFGSQVVASFPAVTSPMPNLTLTRAGQDGITGNEDSIYATTIGATTYGAAPNAGGTSTISLSMYVTGGSTPQTEWDWTVRNYEMRGTITDTYGVRNVPQPYGNLGSIINPNKCCDIIRLDVNAMSSILREKGYWQDGSGDDYTEWNPPFTIRDRNSPSTTLRRIYFTPNTPGTNGVTPVAFFGNQVFTDNGFKA